MEILSITSKELPKYAKIPMTFEVSSRLEARLVDDGLGGIQFREAQVKPYTKNYDEIDGNKPTDWPKRFDISNWDLLLAHDGQISVAGVAVAYNISGTNEYGRLNNPAILWDLRVRPDYRSSGLGTQLFRKAVKIARGKNYKRLKVETQNTNVAACKFYVKQGCQLGEIHRFRYTGNLETEKEIMLAWYLDL